ncbi:MAG: hypothetical protein A2Y93_03980 [Chloroflexi bacterium RBG_13_68_17]|nr:MAG: hypothetical protein A2Y93_03980 [Chloroflexi bacterium RBG_13_68_17]
MPRPVIEHCWVYIITNEHHSVLYTGVTSDLPGRVWQHRSGDGSAFTRRYNATRLVYFEQGGNMLAMIAREKQIKSGSRAKKVRLIEGFNPEWKDLCDEIL